MVAKIADFGTLQSAFITAGRVVTNPRWIAPEVLRDEPYDHKSDVYSFAIILWELIEGKVPFMDQQRYNWAHNVEDDVIKGVRPPLREEGTPEQIVEVIKSAWSDLPENRPSFKKILSVLSKVQI